MKYLIVCTFFLTGFYTQGVTQNNVIRIDSLVFKDEIDTADRQLPFITADYKQAVREIKKTDFHSGIIFFAGYGFRYVAVRDAANLRGFKKDLKKCRAGSSITLARCILRKNGKYSRSFTQTIVLR